VRRDASTGLRWTRALNRWGVPHDVVAFPYRNGTMRLVVTTIPTRRPPDHLQLVIVAVSHDVAAGVGKPAHDVEMSRRAGPVHRVGVVSFLTRVDVESSPQKLVHHGELAGVGRGVEQRPFVRLLTRSQLVRVRVEKCDQSIDVAAAGSVEQLAVHRE